eukprot:m.59476 g.59476  ORF g.59476 m.59476 type:complete len:57 (-) comp9465_c0_seq1:269-439(-)
MQLRWQLLLVYNGSRAETPERRRNQQIKIPTQNYESGSLRLSISTLSNLYSICAIE